MAKVAGYNCVRFIAGMGLSEQMDFADEIGLMVYEECLAGWNLGDSPDMKRRFELSVREMILRDRNHPSITIWGLLNETGDGPVFRTAVESLKLVRELDDTRLVLLSSGRWDCHPNIGSVSNPGSDRWEHEWGGEAPDAASPPARPISRSRRFQSNMRVPCEKTDGQQTSRAGHLGSVSNRPRNPVNK
jgi:hypothetical protein